MPLDISSVGSSDLRFITRAIESESVFLLATDDGVASSVSTEDEQTTILMFWSDAADARRVQASGFEEFRVEDITLFDFMYRWLPGMADDGVLAGVNWDQDLIGNEVDPLELSEVLEEAMPTKLAADYAARLDEPSDDA